LEGIAPDPGPMVPCPVAVEVVEMSLEGSRVRFKWFERGQAMKGRGGRDREKEVRKEEGGKKRKGLGREDEDRVSRLMESRGKGYRERRERRADKEEGDES
jgi:hypothetical protein